MPTSATSAAALLSSMSEAVVSEVAATENVRTTESSEAKAYHHHQSPVGGPNLVTHSINGSEVDKRQLDETPKEEDASCSAGDLSTHIETPSPGNAVAEPEGSIRDGELQEGSLPDHDLSKEVLDEAAEATTAIDDKADASDILPAIPLDNSAAATGDDDVADDKWHGDDEEAGWKRGRNWSKWDNDDRRGGGGWKGNWKGKWKKDEWKKDENGKWVEVNKSKDDDNNNNDEDGESNDKVDDSNGTKEDNNRRWGGSWESTLDKDAAPESAEVEDGKAKETKEERRKRRQEEAAKFADPDVIAELERDYAMTLSKVVDEKRKFQEKFEQLSRVIQAAEVRQKDMNLAGHNLIHQLKAALEDFDKADQGQGGAMEEAVKTIPGANSQEVDNSAPAGFEWRHVEKVGISSRGPPLPSQEEIYAQAVNFGQVHSYSDRWGGNTNTAWRNSSDNSSWNNNKSWDKEGGRGGSYDRQRGGGNRSWQGSRGGGGSDNSGYRRRQWE